MSNFDSAFSKVIELATDFEDNIHHYLKPDYSEAQVRLDFIDKFFIALGWDVRNDNRSNPLHREVKIERTQKQQQSKAQKRADYAFYLKPDFNNVRFFVEAKKPSRNLNNADDYFQTARYGWNAGVGISILTDFEELHIVDCRFKPDINRVFDGKNRKFHFTDYKDRDKFAELYWLLSRQAVADGNIDHYVENLPKPKKGASQTTLFGGKWQSIDESFLEYIDDIRESLAKAFKKNDHNLTSELLTEAVTRTIDRLVFIRFLEDKLIEPENYVSEFGNRTTAWKDFISTCRILEAKYNGIVFKKHFIDEQLFNGADDLEFKRICSGLSHLNSPYDFNVIPIYILGSIYERFLGKVVIATEKRVKIEEKPEVRKAGGVYYTPKYIVDYIVENSVGRLIKGKKPSEIAKLKFADISCGSGSFLIAILETLINYHTFFYNQNPLEAIKDKCLQIEGSYVLSIRQKQQILLNNVYGVDLDHQATEVTQLSLYLKMLEDETTATANEMQVLFHEKILPDLSKNIRHGNSLIGSDVLNNDLFSLDQGQEYKIYPMDFEIVFPFIKTGGFDAIIGNPPYGAELSDFTKNYLIKKYVIGITDTAALFMVKSYNLLRNDGILGFIIPKSFTYASNWKKTREVLIKDITTLVDCSKVWKEVKLEMSIILCQKNLNSKNFISGIRSNDSIKILSSIDKLNYEQFEFLLNGVTDLEIALARKVKASGYSFNNVISNKRGAPLQNSIKNLGEFQVWGGKQISRYNTSNIIKGYIDKSEVNDEKAIVAVNSILVQNIVAHVMNPFPQIKIIATIPSNFESIVILDTVNQLINKSEFDIKFILGVLNSKLISWFTYKFIFANAIRTMHFDSVVTAKIPFPDFKNIKSHKVLANNISNNVQQIINSYSQINKVRTETDKNYLLTKIENAEWQINNAIYTLFDLSDSDIQIVENS